MAADVKKHIKKSINSHTPDDIRAIKSRTKGFVPLMFMLPALFFFALFTIIPLIKVIIDSTGHDAGAANGFVVVWTDGDWFASILNSLIYSILNVPVALILALIISYTIANIIRKNFREFWQTIFFLPYITSSIAISIVFSVIFSAQDYGIVNWILGVHLSWLEQDYGDSPIALVPIFVFGVWHSLAFKVLILTSTMLAIDKRLYDAAAIDGASHRDIFFNITMPALNSTIWYLITIGLIGSLKVFPIGMFDGSSEVAMNRFPTMLTYVYHWVKTAKYANAGAASISLIFVIFIFNIAFRKGIKAIENYFGNKNEREMQREITAHNKKDDEKYNPDETKTIIYNIESHLENNNNGGES